MSTTSALVDRYALQMNGAYPSGNMLLSVQQLLNCGGVGDCNGGSGIEAASWIAENGIGDDTCAPYTGASQVCSDLTTCTFCNDWYEPGWNTGCRVVKKYPKMWVSEFGPISPKQAQLQGVSMVDAMKSEIAARGPIVCNMATDAEWDHYTGGIILPRAWTETDHLVSVSGWGTEGGVPYWIVR
jgi:cathepsin X